MNLAALARYEGLALHVRRGMGDRPGERRFPGHPQPAGIELEGYTAYAPGDDLRHLDWNAVGRLDTLLMRRYTAEREVRFHLLVDCSASMGAPPADRKLAAACELALALAYLGLAGGDAVRVALLRGDAAPALSPLYRHRARVPEAARLLAGATAAGALALGETLAAYARQHPAAAAAIVISDLMLDPDELERGLLALAARRYALVLLQVVGRSELEPDFGRGVLEDAETGASHPVVLTASIRARYQALLGAHLARIEAIAERTRALYGRLISDTDVAGFVTGELAGAGLVRHR
jgi:uncharacterized protein (DUF58 family)